MIAVANGGYHAIAPDLRGYGLSEHHPDLEKASFDDFVEDTIAILDYFQIEKVAILHCINFSRTLAMYYFWCHYQVPTDLRVQLQIHSFA